MVKKTVVRETVTWLHRQYAERQSQGYRDRTKRDSNMVTQTVGRETEI